MRQMCGACQSRHIFERSGNPTSASRTPSLRVPLSGDVALWNLQCHLERGHIACLMCDEVSVSRHFALTTTPMDRNAMKV